MKQLTEIAHMQQIAGLKENFEEQIYEEETFGDLSPKNEIIQSLQSSLEIIQKYIPNIQNIDLEDMSYVIERYIDELNNLDELNFDEEEY